MIESRAIYNALVSLNEKEVKSLVNKEKYHEPASGCFDRDRQSF
jgi:hypothetical protein